MSEANQQPSLGAELRAMAREAIKDIRETVVEQGWFGQRGGPGEPGTPLNPTPQMVTQDLGMDYGHQSLGMEGQSYQDYLREASQRGGQEHSQEMER
jgi:hypothetical protein